MKSNVLSLTWGIICMRDIDIHDIHSSLSHSDKFSVSVLCKAFLRRQTSGNVETQHRKQSLVCRSRKAFVNIFHTLLGNDNPEKRLCIDWCGMTVRPSLVFP